VNLVVWIISGLLAAMFVVAGVGMRSLCSRPRACE
jgi:hypothetical protein